MRISLEFFYTKIKKTFTDTELFAEGRVKSSFSSAGIVQSKMSPSSDVLYVDLFSEQVFAECVGISVVTIKSRISQYSGCNIIALPDTVVLTDIFNLISDIFTKYFSWADTVYEAVAKNMDLQKILNLTSAIIDNPMYIADSSWKMLANCSGVLSQVSATWRYQQKYGYLPYHVMQTLIDSGEIKLMNESIKAFRIASKGFVIPFICKPIRKDGKHYGYFFIIELNNGLDRCDIEIAEYLGEILSTSVYNTKNYLEISSFYHEHFIVDIIEGTLVDRQLIEDQLRPLKFKLEGDYLLFLMETENDNDAIRHHIMALLTNDLNGQCLVYNESILVIIADCEKKLDTIYRYLRRMVKDFNRRGTVSERFIGFYDLHKYYNQVNTALEFSKRNGGKIDLVPYSSVYIDHLLKISAGKIPEYTQVTILRKYDTENNTDFCRTLYTWLLCERNTVKAASELFLHRNTMKYRLDKIFDIISVDTDLAELRTRLLLSLHNVNSKLV